MTEPAERSAAARLDELAAVTREYARYASERSGLACSAIGICWLATFALALRSATWSRISALWCPLMTIGLVWAGRRYYQRFGYVAPARPAPPGAPFKWRKSVRLAVVLTAAVVVNTTLNFRSWSAGSALAQVALLGVVASAPALPLLLDRVAVAFWDDGLVVFSLGLAQMTAGLTVGEQVGWVIAKAWMALIAALGVGLVAAGIHQHLQYRRLERRLAAVRGSAP